MRTILVSILTFAVGVLGALALVWWLVPAPPPFDNNTETIAAAWNRTISQLDIEPLFPPEEDVYVGDVFVVVTAGDPAQVGRMVKIWHVDMSDDLKQAYAGMPFFEKVAEPTPPVAAADFSLFRSSTPPHDLSLVAFPGFAVRHAREARAGVSDGFLGRFGIGRNSQETLEFQITSTATYGVPSLMATNQLAKLCTDPFTAQLCTQDVARRELSMVVGLKAEEKTGDTYALDVELILVSRVYLTRSIAQRRDADSAIGAQALLAARLQGLAQQQSALVKEASSAPPSAAPTLRDGLEATQKQLSALSQQVAEGLPSSTISYGASEGSTITLQQSFDRPLVIGYRAVRTMLPYPGTTK